MRRVFASAVAVGLGLGSIGCSNSAPQFVDALPTADQVAIDVPGSKAGTVQGGNGVGSSSSALVGATSELYQVTYGVAASVNTGTALMLATLRAMALSPVTQVNHIIRTWGPVKGVAGDPLNYRLVVTEVEPQHYAFSFEAAAKATYLPLIDGETISGDRPGTARGSMIVHYDNRRQLLTDTCEQGTIAIAYDNTKDRVINDVTLDQFANLNPANPLCLHEKPADAAYHFERLLTGQGNFLFEVRKDMVAPASGTSNLEEQLTIRSRWDHEGAGRSDFVIEGGDVAARLSDAGLSPKVTGSQCWNTRFETVFQTSAPTELHVYDTSGSDTGCVYAPLSPK